MKTAVIPQVCIEPELGAELDAVLRQGGIAETPGVRHQREEDFR